MTYLSRIITCIGFTLLYSSGVSAFDIVMSDAEWLTWPEYCKTRYSQLGASKNSRFRKFYSPQLGEKWNRILGPDNYRGVQHFCAGRIWLKRAAVASQKKQRTWAYQRAITEFSFSYDHGNINAPYYSEMTAFYARSYYSIGNRRKAHSLLNTAIESKPKSPYAYTEKASILRKEGKLNEAIAILMKALEAVGNRALNVYVYLAHTHHDKGDYKKSKFYSDKAYSLGYPLPGLRKKIESMKN